LSYSFPKLSSLAEANVKNSMFKKHMTSLFPAKKLPLSLATIYYNCNCKIAAHRLKCPRKLHKNCQRPIVLWKKFMRKMGFQGLGE